MNRPMTLQRTVRRRGEGEKTPATQRNAWEQQADEAGWRFAKNRPGKPRRLTPALAASYTLPSSPGTPLPYSLRAELESSFNADLGAVRIHRDAAASAATQQEDALAFAAGRDIFFDQAAAPFDTEPGRELLAHEVAHVLQQTGREDSKGRLQATDVGGTGEVQRKGEGTALRRSLPLDFDLLTSTHRGNADDPKQFDQVVSAVHAILGGRLDETSDGAAALEAAILRKDPKLWKYVEQSESHAGYIFDILKFTDRFAGAAAVLQQQTLLLTYAPLAPFLATYYLEHIDPEAAFFEKIAPVHQLLFPFWPERFYDTFLVFLYGPTRAVPTLADRHGNSFSDTVKKYDEEQKTQKLLDNELVFAVRNGVVSIDRARVKTMTQLHDEVMKTLDPEIAPVAFRYALSIATLQWSQGLQKSPEALVRRVGEAVQSIAQAAIDYWKATTSADPTFDLTLSSTKPDPKKESKRKARLIPNEKLFTQEIPEALLTAAKVIAKNKSNGDLPSVSEYAAQIAAGVGGLKKFVLEHLELKLIERARKGNANDDFGVATGWFLLWFQSFFKQAQSYKAAEDSSFEKKFSNAPDVRFAHRFKLERTIGMLIIKLAASKFPAWKALEEQTEEVFENKVEGRSRLTILGEWKPQRAAPIKEIAADFSAGFADTFSSLTASQLANVYLLIYSTDLTQELKSQVANAGQDFIDPAAALKKKSLVNQAIEATDVRSRPVRYTASDWVYADNSNLTQNVGGNVYLSRDEVFTALIENHPKTRQLWDAENAKGRTVFYAKSPYNAASGELFLWSFPDPALVFTALRRIDALNAAIARLSGLPVEDVRKLTDERWIDEFSKSVGSGANVDVPLDAALTQAKTDLHAELRIAVSHERLLIVALIKRLLTTYTGRADTYEYPLAILHRIDSFGHWAIPHEDQEAQIAALLLAIAPDLLEALKGTTRFDVITGYYGYLLLALVGSEGSQLNDLARIVPDERERATLIANRSAFDELLKLFDEKRADKQIQFGFRSDDGKGLKAIIYEEEIEAGKPFVIDGYKFNLVKVHRVFTFNRSYGSEGTPAYRAALIDGKVWGTEYKPTGQILFEIVRDSQRDKVKDTDLERLTFYSNIIEERANIQGLEGLNDIIVGFAELTLDAVELIPGVGQGVAAAHIIASVVQFLASGEFEDVKEVITNHPLERLESIWENLEDSLKPENLWLFILFGNPVFDWLKNKILSPREQTAAATQEPTSKLGKILAGVRGIERGLGRAWDWLEGHLQHPLRQFQAFVLSHPILALIIDLVSDNIEHVLDLKDWFQSNDKEARFTETAQDVNDAFRMEMENLLDTFQQIRLPMRVIPNDLIIQVIIDLILNRLGTKGKVARLALDTLGLTARVSKLIDDKLVTGSGIDPNVYWQDHILNRIEEKLDPVRDAVVLDVYGFLTGPPFSLPMKAPVTGVRRPLKGVSGDYFPEAAPYLDPDSDEGFRRISFAPPPRPSAGTPLPSPMRSSAERRFGHDFSHVRLHTGSEAAAVTGSFGAAGLTTGSHVYMNPSLPTTSPKGRQVFDHELTHVLQQTGPRPLGGDYGNAPSIGREGGGLRYDAAQESAANRVSGAVQSRTSGGPVDPGPLKSGGYQPAILSLRVLRRFMRDLTDVEKAKQAQRSFDKEALTGSKDIDDDQIKIGTDMWNAVREMLIKSELPKASPNLAAVSTEFLTYFKNIASGISGPIIEAIAFAVSEPEKDRTAAPDAPPKRKLHPKRFVGGIEDYLLAKAGILVNIKLDHSEAVEKVTVKNLLLDFVSSGTPLWSLAMSNAGIAASDYETLRPILRAKLREVNTKNTFVEIRAGRPSLAFVWDRTAYAFHHTFVESAREQATAEAKKGRPADLPRFSTYLDHKAKGASNTGIRIGRYGDRKNLQTNDRESHHTTQFLLIEYFRNKSDNEPFPKELRAAFNALGVSPSKGASASFAPAAAKSIDFAALDTGERGEAMPAILLAKPTHREANLHISGATPEDFGDGAGLATQGAKLHSTFLSSLQNAGAGEIAKSFPTNSSPADPTKMQAHVSTVGASQAAAQVYTAIQSTYGWMYRHMLPALERGLHDNERDYYEMIVAASHTDNKGKQEERIHPDYDLQPDQMEPIYTAAEENNNSVMRAAGWIEPSL